MVPRGYRLVIPIDVQRKLQEILAKRRKNFLYDADNCNLLLAQTKGYAEGEML